MARYQVILSYDGTGFCGFQRQDRDRGRRSVQLEFEDGLRRIGWQGKSTLAAGRTDAGVHAKGQVIAFDFEWRHTPQVLRLALNANLPPSLSVNAVSQVRENFHPRYDALYRSYQYRIFCQEIRDPLRERFAWRIWPPVDDQLLMAAAAALIGTYDFSAFGTPPRTGGSTIRQVFHSAWRKETDGLVFEIRANAFLYHMVRRLVGFQIALSQGNHTLEDLTSRLLGGNQELVRELAPAHGLCLVEVGYPPSIVLDNDLE